MAELHCETFEMRIHFEPQDMDTSAFLKVLSESGISAQPDDDGDIKVSLTFPGSAQTRDEYHVHLTVSVWKTGTGRVDLSYHVGGTEKGSRARVDADDCAKWLGAFFKEKVTAHVHVNYTFDGSFETAVPLPFPLVTAEKSLAGSMVSGLALVLPNETKTAILQRIDDEVYVFLRSSSQIDLMEFDLLTELQSLSTTVDGLVKKTG